MRFVEQNKKRVDPRYFSEELLKEEIADIKSVLSDLDVSTSPFDQTKFTSAERNKIMNLINARREGKATDEQIRIAIDMANKSAQMRAAQPKKQMTPQEKQAAEKSKQDLRKKSVMGKVADPKDIERMFKAGPDDESIMKKAFAGTGGSPDPSKMPGGSPTISAKPATKIEPLKKPIKEAKNAMLFEALIKKIND